MQILEINLNAFKQYIYSKIVDIIYTLSNFETLDSLLTSNANSLKRYQNKFNKKLIYRT